MRLNLYFYRDNNGEPCEVYNRDNVLHDAVRKAADGKELWEVRILPNNPVNAAKVVAHRDKLEEAVEVLEQLADGTFPMPID